MRRLDRHSIVIQMSPSAPDMLSEGPGEGDPDIEEKVHDEASGSQLLPAPQTQLYPSVADQTDGVFVRRGFKRKH